MNALVRPDHHRLAGLGLRIEHRRVDALVPYARNARTHSEAQVALIAGSIREFGFTSPLLIDGENGIMAGHGRLLAARKLGLAEVPVIELAHLSPAQKRALVLADNKLAERAGWDEALLALEAGELAELGVDLSALGFEAGEIDDLLHGDPADPREEETPEPPVAPVSRPGDLWLMGPHRVLCGDATEAGDVARLLGGVEPQLMVTDPPYGVEYDPAWRNRSGASRTDRIGKVLNDDRADWREAWALFPGAVAYVWHGALHAGTVAESLVACGFAIRSPDHLGEGAAGALPRATTTGSTSHAGTRCEARRTGRAIASRPRSGRCRAGTRMPPPCTARRSPSS